jgi:hypothetical protein
MLLYLICINRTFMELKFLDTLGCIITGVSINRTFMELKLKQSTSICTVSARINRTFMELKLSVNIRSGYRYRVLIVPLWN